MIKYTAMIISAAELPKVRQDNPRGTECIALTTGCYDLVHPGHWRHLEMVASLASIVVVSVLGDKKVKELKGPTRPIQSEQSRAEVVDGSRCVDYTVIEPYDETSRRLSALGLMAALQPDIFVGDETWLAYAEAIRNQGTELVIDSIFNKVDSTTDIVGRVVTGLEAAAPLSD